MEFALIVPVLVLILFAIITVGWVFYVQNNMESAARAAVRRMAVAEAAGINTPVNCDDAQAQLPGTAENVACTWLPQVSDGAITVLASPNVCPDRNIRVEISVAGSDAAIGDLFGFFSGVTMRASAEMRAEAACPT